MLKRTILILFAFLICIHDVNSQCYQSGDTNSIEKKTCLDRKVDLTVDGGNIYVTQPPTHCCYAKTTSTDSSGKEVTDIECEAYNKDKLLDDLDKAEKIIDGYKEAGLVSKDYKYEVDIDCSSSFIKYGIMTLLLFIF